jgi:nitrilase
MSSKSKATKLKVALAQIAPIWLNKRATIDKILDTIAQAAKQDAELVVFGESFLPGYPFWLERTEGATFNSEIQKVIHAKYLNEAVCIEDGDLNPICALAKSCNIAVVLGIDEHPADRGGHSIYCSLVYIDAGGIIQNVHRKLMPTYEERLSWSPGDGHGLRTFPLGPFTMGALNCWENWMPLPRAALYAQGENLHIAIWPGNEQNTQDITRFIAKEGRSFVISVSAILRPEDIPTDMPFRDQILARGEAWFANGGSCIAAPNGDWVIEPQVKSEGIFVASLDREQVYMERQNFDPAGHYSRPDVTQLTVNRARQSTVVFDDD